MAKQTMILTNLLSYIEVDIIRNIIIIGFLFGISCQKDDVESIYHRDIDSTVYAINNISSGDIEVNIWNKGFAKSVFSFDVKTKESFTFSEYDISTFPQYLPMADSCEILYNGIVKIVFYPLYDFYWENAPISPLTHNDSVLIHYPFRQSNCKITVKDTELGKQRIYCEYTITEDDYNYAIQNAK